MCQEGEVLTADEYDDVLIQLFNQKIQVIIRRRAAQLDHYLKGGVFSLGNAGSKVSRAIITGKSDSNDFWEVSFAIRNCENKF